MTQAIDIILKGGIVMIPLLACSLISLALTIERLIFWARIKSQQAVQNMLGLVEAGEFDKALNSARNRSIPIARVLAAGLAHRNPAPAKAMEAAAQAQIPAAQKPAWHARYHHHPGAAAWASRNGCRHDRIFRHHVRGRHGSAPRNYRRRRRSADRHRQRAADRDFNADSLQLLHYACRKRDGRYGALQLIARVAAARTIGETLMRIQRRNLKKARIEIIPMIDTIFFLLVFFMISTLSMAQYRGMPVNLPKAASGQQAPAESAAITIDKESRIFLNKEEVDQAALGDLLRQQLEQNADLLVVINADDGVEHGRVVEVMDIARAANVAKMAIAVKPKEQKR